MQTFTKNELVWIIGELDKKAAEYRNDAEKEEARGLASGIMKLRSEQLASISDRLQKVIDEGCKRIAIKY